MKVSISYWSSFAPLFFICLTASDDLKRADLAMYSSIQKFKANCFVQKQTINSDAISQRYQKLDWVTQAQNLCRDSAHCSLQKPPLYILHAGT